jgi:predicted HD phosphohydrolase
MIIKKEGVMTLLTVGHFFDKRAPSGSDAMYIQAPQWGGHREQFVEALFAWLGSAGAVHYDEQVTQLEHALQTAELARRDQAAAHEIVAALLHDVGHCLVDEYQGYDELLRPDLHHEEVGARWLAQFFPAEVTALVRLHVPAKRWLCTMDAEYWQSLSEVSRYSLLVQGGKMLPEERAAFQAHPEWQAAVALRQRDDLGKHKDIQVPALESFRSVVLEVLKA